MRSLRLTRRITLFVAWYDIWIGVYIDAPKRKVYVMIPFCGVCIDVSAGGAG